jgi:hypothetical protein
MKPRGRDMVAIVEMAEKYLSDGQCGQVIEFVLKLAGHSASGAPPVAEQARAERDVAAAPPIERIP